jgi:hypothetical protein
VSRLGRFVESVTFLGWWTLVVSLSAGLVAFAFGVATGLALDLFGRGL